MAKIIMDENETVNEAVEVENTETPELDADFSVDADSVEDTSTNTEPPTDDSEIDTDMNVETPEETAPTDKEESSDNTQTEENPDENIDNSEDDGISSLPLEDTDLKPVYDEATGQADSVGNGKKWTDGYAIKTKAADADEAMILSTAEKANKRIKFSGIWDWIVDKLASAVVSKLTTTDKTIIGALNELNSKSDTVSYSITPKNEAVLNKNYTWLKKKDNIFYFQLVLTNTSDLTSNIIAEVPSECASNRQVWFPVFGTNGGNYIGRAYINGTNIAITMIEKLSGQVCGFCTYIK